ncbi:GNAT family N-acetyltransferase [Enterovibrio norvegicus]|nr:GNAT family N-acetyltransferase [Enterovibrio norvegicus]PMH72163.1 GNAT family N-acetyltransferase [Enterovibrio norvegicus]PMI32438.1 GNAT family N-acetyltransferase [Enterovibrio norvegicus]PMI37990.1 GNAT family N-acetyltransferase [Enterovibrio norvegicus]PMN56615.1 GNAT family N-acetyltransferase [Enterovibrio norvegicus]
MLFDMKHYIDIVDYHPRYTEDTLRMWRESKAFALGKAESQSLASHRYYLNRVLAACNDIYLAIEKQSGQVLGMIATDGESITQLYVAPDAQRQGIGSCLVELAKESANNGLMLYTVEINQQAREFWQKQGFIECETKTITCDEGMIDVLCEWHPKALAQHSRMGG